jgi:hypothetical protein
VEDIESLLEPGLFDVPFMTAVIFLCCCDVKDPNNGDANGVDMSDGGLGFDFDFLSPSV